MTGPSTWFAKQRQRHAPIMIPALLREQLQGPPMDGPDRRPRASDERVDAYGYGASLYSRRPVAIRLVATSERFVLSCGSLRFARGLDVRPIRSV